VRVASGNSGRSSGLAEHANHASTGTNRDRPASRDGWSTERLVSSGAKRARHQLIALHTGRYRGKNEARRVLGRAPWRAIRLPAFVLTDAHDRDDHTHIASSGRSCSRRNENAGSMIQVRDKRNGRVFGTITTMQLEFLYKQLERESGAYADYHLNGATLEMLINRGADQVLVAVLHKALGSQATTEIECVPST
jgi:hypothetical protein